MFFSRINMHRVYIENAPFRIKAAFVNEHGNCSHCGNERDGTCRHRKKYMIDGKVYEKCDGCVFEFWNPSIEKCQDYINLLEEFYPVKKFHTVAFYAET